MKLKILLAFPIIWLCIFLAVDLNLYNHPDATKIFHRIQIVLTKLVWLAGALSVGLKLKPGEYLRRAWLIFSLTPFIFLVFDALLLVPSDWLPEEQSAIVQGILSLLANLLSTIAIAMLAFAWKVADIELPGPKWSQMAIRVVAFILALLLVGPGVINSLERVLAGQILLLDGQANSLDALASAFGDFFALILLAPLVLTALALRGGKLCWTWLFLILSTIIWLVGDLFYASCVDLNIEPRLMLTIIETFRCLASAYAFAAASAQKMVVDEIRVKLSA